MSVFKPKRYHFREFLLYFFSVMKSTIESHRFLVEAYGEIALSETTYRVWFRRFKSDFDVEDKKCAGRPKLVEDAKLKALLDENPCHRQEEFVESWELLDESFLCV